MKRMEVRCCCTPNKLLGTLPVTDAHGGQVRFALMKPRVNFNEWNRIARPSNGAAILSMKVLPWSHANRDTGEQAAGIALFAEIVTLEQLRLIPGFIEAMP